MRVWYGLVGAVLGAIVGGAAAVMLACTLSVMSQQSDFFALGLFFILGPIGLLLGAFRGVKVALWVFSLPL